MRMVWLQHCGTRFCAVLLMTWGLVGCQRGQPASRALTPVELVAELRSTDAAVRSKAGQTLPGHGESAREPLLTLLADNSSLVESRLFALDCLSKLKTTEPSLREAVLKAVRDPAEEVRRQAVRTLMEFNPPPKLTVGEMRSLLLDVPVDVLREMGTYLWANKVTTTATPSEIAEILFAVCRAPDWHPGAPAVAFGLMGLLPHVAGEPKLPTELTAPLLESFEKLKDRLPQNRRAQLSARLSEIAESPWVRVGLASTKATDTAPNIPPAPAVDPIGAAPAANPATAVMSPSNSPTGPHARFPASTAEQAELQVIDLACELCRLLLKSGHLTDDQFRVQFSLPAHDPFRMWAEREAARLGSGATVAAYVDVLDSGDPSSQRIAAAALSAIEPASSLANHLDRLAPIVSRLTKYAAEQDVELCRSLLKLLGKFERVPSDMGPLLARMVTHSDPGISEAALTALGAMSVRPTVEIQASPALLKLVEDPANKATARSWALQQLERSLKPNAVVESSVRGILQKIANQPDDPLNVEAIRILKAMQISDSGKCLIQIRNQVASEFSDLWVERLVFSPQGQVRVVGWCSDMNTPDACRDCIHAQLKAHGLLDWADWRMSHPTDAGEKVDESQQFLVEVEVLSPDFRTELQALVLKTPELRGCGVLSSKITASGNIQLTGLSGQASQKSKLEQLATNLLNERPWRDRIPGQVTWTSLSVIPATDLLGKLRLWCEQQKIEMWIQDLTIDAAGQLRVTGWCQHGGKESEAIRLHLIEILKKHPLNTFFQEQTPKREVVVTVELEAMQPCWSQLLQSALEGRPKAASVSIEKVYYNARGNLIVEGAQESAGAVDAIKSDLMKIIQAADRRRFLPQGVEFAAFRVQRADDIVVLLQDVMLLHPECNGVRIKSGKRGPKGELNLSGEATVLMTDRRIRQLSSALSQVVGGPKQLSAGVSFSEVKVIPVSPITSERMLQTALTQFLAKKYDAALEPLQVALLHDPNSSTLWFLLGTYYLTKEDASRAQRYLYRAALLEKADSEKRSARLNRLESFQGPILGPLRQQATDVLADVTSHVNDADWLQKVLKITKLQELPVKKSEK